jgi:flagellar hook protein FlgE
MPLSASLNVGVSALKSFAEGIQVTSNNIANVNTIGYKSSRAQYSDTFSNLLKPLVPNNSNTGVKIPPTQIGGGVQIESVAAVFSQGTIQTSSNNSDLAIAGSGFFLVKDVTTGKVMATRAGNFRLDADGYLVTQQGYRVQGASGAKTKVEYDTTTKAVDVKGVQDNHTVAGKMLSQASNIVTLPSVDKISVGMVVTGAGITYGTTVTAIDVSNKTITLSQPPTVTTSDPGETVAIQTTEGSVYATPPSHADISKFSAGMYLGAAGVSAGTTVLKVNKAAGSADGTLSTTAPTGVTTFVATNAANLYSFDADSVAGLAVGMRVDSPAFLTGQINTFGRTFTKVSGRTFTVADAVGVDGITGSSGAVDPLAVGMRVTSADFASGFAYITAIDSASTPKTVTLSETSIGASASSTSIDKGPGYAFIASIDETNKKVTTTLPAAATGNGNENLRFSPGAKTGDSIVYVSPAQAANLSVGMKLDTTVNGIGIAGDGVYISNVDPTTGAITLSQPVLVDLQGQYKFIPTVTMSKAATASASSTPVWKSFKGFPALSFSNYYKPALTVGDAKISFNEGSDYELVDKDNNTLTGLARAEALDGAPRIRTFNVGSTGEISVILSNGQTFNAGYVLLQAFRDPGALIREGSNMFSGVDTAGKANGEFESSNIANLIPGNRGLGAVNGGGLELSNVDLGEEFSIMITTQRAFQAGSRVISTTDSMMEEVVNLKR